MDSISVEFDTRMLRESRQMEIEFENQSDVYCKRPMQCPVIPTKWVGVKGMLEANQLEYRSRLFEKDLKRSGSDVECATLDPLPRKIRSLDASGACRMNGTVSGVASEQQPDEQVVCQDLTGELSNSLSEIRKWRRVFVNYKPKSSTVVCCHERELCGFVHEDDFIITGDSVKLTWIESRLKERLNFEQCVDLGVDDGVDKTVTILSLLATWNDLAGIVLAKMSTDGFNFCTIVRCVWEMQTDTSRNFDCANEMGVREARERRDPGAHLRLYRDSPDRRIMIAHRLTTFRASRLRWQDSRQSRTRRAWSMLKRMVRYRVDA